MPNTRYDEQQEEQNGNDKDEEVICFSWLLNSAHLL